MKTIIELLTDYSEMENELEYLNNSKQATEQAIDFVVAAKRGVEAELRKHIHDNKEYIFETQDGDTYIVRRGYASTNIYIKKAERIG